MDLTPFRLPEKLLLGAGPSNCSHRVLTSLSMQSLGPMDKETLTLLDETRELLKEVFRTKNRLTFAQQTSGSGGMETLIVNLLEPGETFVVAVAGVWGERAAQIAEKFGIEVIRLSVNDGEVYTFAELENAIQKYKPKMLFVTHGESSTGVHQPIEGLSDICHKYNCLLAVDAIITLASAPLYTDDWKLDAVLGATQKAVGAPPGLALLTFSEKAEEIIMNRKTPVPFYFNIKGLAYYWNCFGDKRGYYYTYSTNMVAALREALAEKLEEGLENVWKRHTQVSEYLSKNMQAIGMKHYVEKPENRLNSVCTFVLPDDIKWPVLLDYMYEKHNMSISFGIGPTSNKAIRLGLMGVNSKMIMVDHVTKALKDGMEHCRKNVGNGPTAMSDGIFK